MIRVIHYLLVMFLVLALNFTLPRLLPGDPVTALYGEQDLILTPEFRQEMVRRYALDQNLAAQFWHYLKNLAHGDLGHSFYHHAPVAQVIGSALLWTALLCGISFAISLVLGLPLGVELAWQYRRPWTAGAVAVCLLLEALPAFLLGLLLLMLLSLKLGLFPLFGAVTVGEPTLATGGRLGNFLWHLSLPAATLILGETPGLALLMRSSALKNLPAPYLLAARARGLGEGRLKYRYLARNALLPLITRLGLRFGMLWAGALPVEIVFAYPGSGQLLFQALVKRDYPLLQGLFLVITVMVLAGNALADWGCRIADPRLRETH
jgi:peptide/nickel transport system permease protein